jgi:hypothetical protein
MACLSQEAELTRGVARMNDPGDCGPIKKRCEALRPGAIRSNRPRLIFFL